MKSSLKSKRPKQSKQKKDEYPLVSFVTPMKEKDFRVMAMLKAIRSQDYPQNKIEIIIGDGGSNPEVLKAAKKYKPIIFRRKSEYAEGKGMGKDECIWKAKGEYIIISESDTELIGKNWIKNMLKPFQENPEIFASVPKVFVHPNDCATNRYLSYVGVDPFAIYRSIEGQITLSSRISRIKKYGYSLITMNKKKPYCMGSNGFMFPKSLIKKVGDYAQDVEFIGRLAKNDFLTFAYVENAPIWHKNIKSLNDFIKKRIKWTKDYPKKYAGEKKDFNWVTNKLEFLFFIIKNLLIIPNLPISIKNAIVYKDFAWLLHAPLLWFSTALNTLIALTSRKMLAQAFK